MSEDSSIRMYKDRIQIPPIKSNREDPLVSSSIKGANAYFTGML